MEPESNAPGLPRPLTERERAWLVQALFLLPTGEYMGGGRWVDEETGEVAPLDPPVDPAPYLAQLDGLVVVERCGCGNHACETVTFRGYRPGHAVALVHTETDDGRVLIVYVDEETDELVELEVVGVSPEEG